MVERDPGENEQVLRSFGIGAVLGSPRAVTTRGALPSRSLPQLNGPFGDEFEVAGGGWWEDGGPERASGGEEVSIHGSALEETLKLAESTVLSRRATSDASTSGAGGTGWSFTPIPPAGIAKPSCFKAFTPGSSEWDACANYCAAEFPDSPCCLSCSQTADQNGRCVTVARCTTCEETLPFD